MARDYFIDPVTNGMQLTADGDIRLIEGDEEMAQHVQTQLGNQRGTVLYAPQFGLPLLESIFVKGPNLPLIHNIIKGTLESRPDVESVPFYLQVFDAGARKLTVTFRLLTTEGRLLSSSVVLGGF